VETEGEDRAGIVASVCRVLADRGVNIADLRSESLPKPSGGAIYQMSLLVEVPDRLDLSELAKSLDSAGRDLGIDVRVEPAAR
jgi:glycine cleavage system transcriptional repressor